MPTFTEVLPPSKSTPHRAMKYTPACKGVGVLELTDKRSHVRYALAVQPFGGVRLTKGDGETYVVSPAACECAAFTLRGHRCKHIEAVTALVTNNWLDADDRETVGDTHADAEERDAYYGDAFENDNGPDRMQDDAHADVLGRTVYAEMGGC